MYELSGVNPCSVCFITIYEGRRKSEILFTDLGLRNARLNFRQQESTHIIENIVYNELLIHGYNVDVDIVQIFDKDKRASVSVNSWKLTFWLIRAARNLGEIMRDLSS